MNLPENWTQTAFNQATDSENQIHSDEMAQRFGFKGGLVPGVTVSSYLMHPGLIAWGKDWLTCGNADITVVKPLYDGYKFEVQVSNATASSYEAILVDETGTTCANAKISLNKHLPNPPAMKGLVLIDRNKKAEPATKQRMQALQALDMHALKVRWSAANNMFTYLKDASNMPPLHSFQEAATASGYANGAFMLSLTNWVLAGNAYMNPWIHLQTESQYFDLVENDTNIIVECNITDLFEKKGHEFVDLAIQAYDENSGQCVMTAKLRAIYLVNIAS